MLEEKKDDILGQNYVLNKRKNVRVKTHFLATKNRYFLVGILISIIIVIALYLILPTSNVFKVIVKGNRYLEDSYYEKLAKISDSDKYLLVVSPLVEREIKKDPIVEEVKVKHIEHGLIEIDVKEKMIIGYTYDDIPNLVLEDGSKVALTNEYLHMISKVPLIEGYNDEEIKIISMGFDKLDPNMINEISEIHKYPFSYDDKMLEIIMRDGNYVYLSYYSLMMLNDYYSIASGIKSDNTNVCIFLDDVTNSGYVSDCPYWNSEKPKEDNQEEVQNNESEEVESNQEEEVNAE